MNQTIYKLFLTLLFISHFSLAQHPVYIDMNQKEELPDIEFYDIIEDKKGFIWLAANNGLYRYDGKEFKNYSHSKKRGLSVFGLKFDNKNRLWCNNISGQYFYIENDSLKFYTDLKKYTKGQLGEYFFHQNKIIVHTFNKFIEVDILTKKVTDNTLKKSNIPYIFKKADTLFFLKQNNLLYKVHDGKEKVKSNFDITYNNSTSHKMFVFDDYFLHQSFDRTNSTSKLYFGKDTLSLLSDKVLKHDQLIINTLKDGNKLWFCSEEAVYIYQYHQGKFLLKETLFKGKGVTKMLKDSKGNYWFITSNNGVYIIPNIHLQKYNLLREKNITALEKINDSILIFGTTTGEINSININSSNVKPIYNPYFEKVDVLAYNGKDEIYVSQSSKSFALSATDFSYKSNSKTNTYNFGNAKDLSVIDADRFVYSAFAFADIFDKKKASYTRLGQRRSYTNHYSNSNNEIYVGYVDGLEYYKEDLKPHKIKFNEESIFAIDIGETTDKMVWVSTFNDGILGVKNGEIVCNYNESNGLLSNQTRIIKADGNYLWIVTNKGIQRFNTNTKTFQNLTKKDGISTFVVSDIAISKNKVILGSNNGLFLLDKEKIFKPNKLSDFYFTKVSVEDQKVAIKANYDLSSNVNKIQFQFHTNGFFSEENSAYQYRLLGKTNSWTTVSEGVNEIVFNSLSAGSYTFQLKSIDKTNSEETAIKSINIKINLPFYKKWWFIISAFFAMLISIACYYSWRIKALRNKQKETLEKEHITKQLIASELESLRSQMNPHFIFNALNSIQEYIVLNEKNLASAYLVKFSRLIRMYLEHSQEQYIPLIKEINALELYLELEKDRFEDSLEYQLSVAKEINTSQIKVPSIFIQPYVENAIKHGLLHKVSNKKLNISFDLAKNKDVLVCTIQDNGIGRKASEDIKRQRRVYHKSYATKANAKRIDLINHTRTKKISISVEDLYNENEEATGTLIHLNIPYESTDN